MDSTGERWRPVVGFEGLYEVSSLGRVRSLDREITHGNPHGTTTTRVCRGRVLKPQRNRDSYLYVTLVAPGRRFQAKVHRLVLEAFVGPSTEGSPWARHLDDDSTNNRLDNLRWGTQAENSRDQVRNGGHHLARRPHCFQGHDYTPENTFTTRTGARGCRECRNAASRRYKARQKEAKHGRLTR